MSVGTRSPAKRWSNQAPASSARIHRPSQLVGVMLNVPSVNWGAVNEDLPAKKAVKSDPEFLAELRLEERDLEHGIVVQSVPLLETVRSTVLVDALRQIRRSGVP